jgi:hypothetical protein
MFSLKDQIKKTCGIAYGDLGYNSEKEFDIAISIYIRAIKTWINTYTQKNYTKTSEEYPPALSEIVREIVNRLLANDNFTKDLPIFNNENYQAAEIITQIITPDIIQRLQPYQRKTRIHIIKTWNTSKKKDKNDRDWCLLL